LDLFHDLVYLAKLFPHPQLSLEVPLVEIEERRTRVNGRRKRRRFSHAYKIVEQRLTQVIESRRFCQNADLMSMLPCELPDPFHTAHLAEQLSTTRWLAQRIAYCLRTTGAFQVCGKAGNAILYRRAS
jgi:hypothetical protein